MRGRFFIAVLAIAVILALLPIDIGARGASWRGHFQPLDGSNLNGSATWGSMSETTPLILQIRGAEPSSALSARVCGQSVYSDGTTISYYDQCWAAFVDREAHDMTFEANARGRTSVRLLPKLGVGPTHLVSPDRVELYAEGEVIAVARLTAAGSSYGSGASSGVSACMTGRVALPSGTR